VALVQGCHRKLADGGVLMINSPNVMSHGLHFWVSDYTHNFVTTPERVRYLLRDCGFEPFFERRMTFGFQGWPGRTVANTAFALLPTRWLEAAARLAKPNYRGGAAVYGKENFTVAARKL
jgi:hypothetical protein